VQRTLLIVVLLAASGAANAAAAPSSGASGIYRVQPGDSLSSIAASYGTSVHVLERLNGMRPGATLFAGSKLKLPQREALRTYRVAPGDTLSGIAASFHSSVAAIARASGVAIDRPLYVGTLLRVPVSASPALATSGLLYTVRPGDSLSAIALHFRVGLSQLVGLNHLRLSAPLLIGTRLLVPRGAVGLSAAPAVAPADPYQSGADGVDVSYPNCATAGPPTGFVVVGLNAGRPFTLNPCAASEFAWAHAGAGPAGIYLNSSFSPQIERFIQPGCLGKGSEPSAALARAWALGCSEASAALAGPLALSGAAVVWIDVEISNSWSPDPALNVATLTGMLATLANASPAPAAVGIYSNTLWWSAITGGWQLPTVPEWSQSTANGCPTSFAGGPPWLGQQMGATLDSDVAC
jgi:LysM repeat protein